MLLGMIILWGAVLALVIWGTSRLFPRCRPTRSRDSLEGLRSDSDPFDVLKRRLGLGELTREQYELMRGDIAEAETAAHDDTANDEPEKAMTTD